MSKSNPNIESAFVSAVYRACVKVHNHTLNGTGERNGTDQNVDPESENTDFGAIMYISAVLLFYSTGIIIMIVKYLKTEKAEIEEDLALERFFKHMPSNRIEKEYHVNKMAIRAFHTLTTSGHGQVAKREIPGERGSLRYVAPKSSDTVINVDNDPKTLLVTDV